ncbi:MAG: hypothetical protein ACYTEK_20000 [Planctomycetota bacterium]|jgi:hypothetical protein
MNDEEIEQLARRISIDRAAINHGRILADAEAAIETTEPTHISQICTLSWFRLPIIRWAGALVATVFVISSWITCFVLHGQNSDLRHQLKLAQYDVTTAPADDSATINFYLEEHQDVVARHASLSPAQPEPMQIRVSQDDILYYELLDGQPDTMYPGIIVRGSLSQGQISPPKEMIISNGHTLSLSEAKETADFNLVAPLRLHPGFQLDQIRRIDGRDALQLLYTNAIKSVSLFEQPLDGQRGLEAKDFREYAVYFNAEQAGGTILAWKDHELSYVLIGDADMTQLMDMAQSISAAR